MVILSRRKLPFLDKLRSILFPNSFALGFCYESADKPVFDIILSMDIIDRLKAEPLGVFIHELLHLKRPSDCPTEGCIGRRYYKEYFICEKCSKLLEDIVNGNF